jgi:hypothetical protein
MSEEIHKQKESLNTKIENKSKFSLILSISVGIIMSNLVQNLILVKIQQDNILNNILIYFAIQTVLYFLVFPKLSL